MKCPKCKTKYKPEDVQIKDGKFKGEEYLELSFHCDNCNENTSWTRIIQKDLIELEN